MAERDRAAELMGAWAEDRERGESTDPDDVIRENPEIAEELSDAFLGLEYVDLAFPPDGKIPAALPESIGDFEILDELGRGGMGTVYMARPRGEALDACGSDRVALKVLHPHLLERRGYFKRFLREAEMGRRVEHENVVRTIDVDAAIADGATYHFLVMEYVEGSTLRDLLADLGTVPEVLLREIARQVAAGLTAVHAAGIVHRDIKPENVLITHDHVVRIMDLGVAHSALQAQTLTREGQFVGSLAYAAPEQFGTGEITAAADLYSLGVLLYEMATGTNPFRHAEIPRIIDGHVNHQARRVDELQPQASAFLTELISTLLAKQPENRCGSAEELARLLQDGEQSAWWRQRRRALQLRAGRCPPVHVRRETRLYGREDELALLRESLEEARRGNGVTVFFEGEAGIGKSRLVDAFLRSVVTTDVHLLYGSYAPSGGTGGLAAAVVEHLGTGDLAEALAEQVPHLAPLMPAFGALLRAEPVPPGARPLRPDAVHVAFSGVMQSLAEEKPLVWVIDDLHFASEDSRRIVLSLARAAREHRVLLVLTARPGLPERELVNFASVPGFRRAKLPRLSPRQVIELLRDAFRSEQLAEKLGGRIAYKSDGVPFFVFEMIRALKEGRFITQLPDGTCVETRVVERIEVPSAVRDLIEARLEGLTDAQRAILDVGAVEGFDFDPDLVARVLERRRIHVLQDLAAMERRTGVVGGHGDLCRFDHHQIQEVLYEDLLPPLRADYHALLAEAIEARRAESPESQHVHDGATAARLSMHYFRGRRAELAARHVERGVQFLIGSYRNDNAVELCRLALADTDALSSLPHAELLLQLARALDVLGRRDEQRETLDEALRVADERGDLRACARARVSQGGLLTRLDRYDEAVDVMQEAIDVAERCGDTDILCAALGNLGNALGVAGRIREAKEQHRRLLELAREIGSRQREASALGSLAEDYKREGRFQEAERYGREYLRVAREIGDRPGEALAANNLASTLHSQGRLRECGDLVQDAVQVAHSAGARWEETLALGTLGNLRNTQGDLDSALALIRRQLAISREIGYRRGEAIALINIAKEHIALGDRTTTESLAIEARDIFQAIRLDAMAARALFLSGHGAEWSGDHSAATERYRQAIGELQTANEKGWLAEAHVALGRTLRAGGDQSAAVNEFESARALTGDAGDAFPLVLAHAYLAVLHGTGGSDAAALLKQCADALDAYMLVEAHFAVWCATRDLAQLRESHRLLEFIRDHAPEEYRESMIENVPLHREIVAAWKEHGGGR